MCASFACKLLYEKLTPEPIGSGAEWGTTIFRWQEDSGHRYSFQTPVYKGLGVDSWKPLGLIPKFTEEWAHCHTHPNGTYFSTVDIETALGERGLVRKKTVMYLVNHYGAYWFDGRTEFLTREQRKGKLWGEYPPRRK